MKNESIAKWLRIALGAFLIVYALNQFLHFLPTSYGQMPASARDFIDAVVMYLPFLYVFEIIIGLLLIIDKWTSLILIVLFPLSVSFVIFLFANKDVGETWPALFVALANILLIVNRKEKYSPLFD